MELRDFDYDQSVNKNSINALSLADVKAFYNQIIPANTYLTIAGDIDNRLAKASTKKAFENWGREKMEE